MKHVKFLHCADFHMDMPFTSLASEPGKSTARRLDIKTVFQRIISLAREEKADLLIISGDLYEHSYVKKATINFINDNFETIPNTKVIIIPGNHDPYVSTSYYKNFIWSPNVHILTEERNYVVLEELQTCVYGFGFSSFTSSEVHFSEIKHFNPDMINILILHGTVDLGVGNDSYNPVKSLELSQLNMDYIALGHFHNRIDNVGDYGVIYNPGSPEPLGFDEQGLHGVYTGEISKNQSDKGNLKIHFLNTNIRTYKKMELDISHCSTDEQVIKKIEAALYAEKDQENLLLSIILKGHIDRDFKLNFDHILNCFKDKVFFIKIEDDTAPDYDFDEMVNEPGLMGIYTRKILELIEKSKDEYERQLLIKALYYGIEALERGEVNVN